MGRLLIFNPETDYALGSGLFNYTAPGHVLALRRRMALLPVLYARPGEDVILLLDGQNPEELLWYDMVCDKQLEVVDIARASQHPELYSGLIPDPWGWNPQIRHMLLTAFGEMPGLPSERWISDLRELSHRRTTITMLREMNRLLDDEITLPREIWNIDEAMAEFNRGKELYFKAPWSSSGRGILFTRGLEHRHVEPWIRGIINRQGSVMMEKAYDRRVDFATEWQIESGKVRFMGLSVFDVSDRGKYHGQHKGTQRELWQIIVRTSREWGGHWIDAQRNALERVVAPHYDGPLGIDMLVTGSGAINPCVELNLRHTMGMIGELGIRSEEL